MDDVYMERMVVERHDRKRKVWLKAAIAYQQTGLSALAYSSLNLWRLQTKSWQAMLSVLRTNTRAKTRAKTRNKPWKETRGFGFVILTGSLGTSGQPVRITLGLTEAGLKVQTALFPHPGNPVMKSELKQLEMERLT